MRLPDGAVHAARLRRPRHDLLHREHHVRGVPRAGVRAAAAPEAHGARRTSGPEERPRFLHVLIYGLRPAVQLITTTTGALVPGVLPDGGCGIRKRCPSGETA